jgi:hypothetical protein
MDLTSSHLDKIIKKHNRTSNLQVVFIDIEKYSKRRSLTQIGVIDSFTEFLKKALLDTSSKYIDYIQNNNINFQDDIIRIPTGDGSAIVFSFDGLADIHLYFAKQLLQIIYQNNIKDKCSKFEEQGWCNCHFKFHVRIGISEDRGIIYRDINGLYNVAGNVINLASRVMNLGDRAQILFTSTAYQQIIDMVDDPDLVDRFREYLDIEVKHGLKLNVYQYIGESEDFLNSKPPEDLQSRVRALKLTNDMRSAGLSFIDPDAFNSIDKDAMFSMMENLMSLMTNKQTSKKIFDEAIDIKKREDELI